VSDELATQAVHSYGLFGCYDLHSCAVSTIHSIPTNPSNLLQA
jgi:hypothetical protein